MARLWLRFSLSSTLYNGTSGLAGASRAFHAWRLTPPLALRDYLDMPVNRDVQIIKSAANSPLQGAL
jgi:hypothetical protein